MDNIGDDCVCVILRAADKFDIVELAVVNKRLNRLIDECKIPLLVLKQIHRHGVTVVVLELYYRVWHNGRYARQTLSYTSKRWYDWCELNIGGNNIIFAIRGAIQQCCTFNYGGVYIDTQHGRDIIKNMWLDVAPLVDLVAWMRTYLFMRINKSDYENCRCDTMY